MKSLPPLKESALRAMLRAPLQLVPDVGWSSVIGLDGLWNSHTVRWLAWRGYAQTFDSNGKTLAKLTPGGRAVVIQEDFAA